jgi:hypothetical protein
MSTRPQMSSCDNQLDENILVKGPSKLLKKIPNLIFAFLTEKYMINKLDIYINETNIYINRLDI